MDFVQVRRWLVEFSGRSFPRIREWMATDPDRLRAMKDGSGRSVRLSQMLGQAWLETTAARKADFAHAVADAFPEDLKDPVSLGWLLAGCIRPLGIRCGEDMADMEAWAKEDNSWQLRLDRALQDLSPEKKQETEALVTDLLGQQLVGQTGMASMERCQRIWMATFMGWMTAGIKGSASELYPWPVVDSDHWTRWVCGGVGRCSELFGEAGVNVGAIENWLSLWPESVSPSWRRALAQTSVELLDALERGSTPTLGSNSHGVYAAITLVAGWMAAAALEGDPLKDPLFSAAERSTVSSAFTRLMGWKETVPFTERESVVWPWVRFQGRCARAKAALLAWELESKVPAVQEWARSPRF